MRLTVWAAALSLTQWSWARCLSQQPFHDMRHNTLAAGQGGLAQKTAEGEWPSFSPQVSRLQDCTREQPVMGKLPGAATRPKHAGARDRMRTVPCPVDISRHYMLHSLELGAERRALARGVVGCLPAKGIVQVVPPRAKVHHPAAHRCCRDGLLRHKLNISFASHKQETYASSPIWRQQHS